MYVSDSQENNICYKVKIVSSKDSLLHDYEICNNPKNIFLKIHIRIKLQHCFTNTSGTYLSSKGC